MSKEERVREKVAGLVSEDDLLAFALTCKEFRELQLALTPHTKMKVDQFSFGGWEVTRGWILWVFDLLIELPDQDLDAWEDPPSDPDFIPKYLDWMSWLVHWAGHQGYLDVLKEFDDACLFAEVMLCTVRNPSVNFF